jgi:hypothetical protein
VHDADEGGAAGDGSFDILRIDAAVAIDADVGDLAAELAQKFARLQRGRMFDGTCDDMRRTEEACEEALHPREDDALDERASSMASCVFLP